MAYRIIYLPKIWHNALPRSKTQIGRQKSTGKNRPFFAPPESPTESTGKKYGSVPTSKVAGRPLRPGAGAAGPGLGRRAHPRGAAAGSGQVNTGLASDLGQVEVVVRIIAASSRGLSEVLRLSEGSWLRWRGDKRVVEAQSVRPVSAAAEGRSGCSHLRLPRQRAGLASSTSPRSNYMDQKECYRGSHLGCPFRVLCTLLWSPCWRPSCPA